MGDEDIKTERRKFEYSFLSIILIILTLSINLLSIPGFNWIKLTILKITWVMFFSSFLIGCFRVYFWLIIPELYKIIINNQKELEKSADLFRYCMKGIEKQTDQAEAEIKHFNIQKENNPSINGFPEVIENIKKRLENQKSKIINDAENNLSDIEKTGNMIIKITKRTNKMNLYFGTLFPYQVFLFLGGIAGVLFVLIS